MSKTIQQFLNHYYEVWRTSDLRELEAIISKDYQGREISGGEIIDFGYEQSIKGWEQGFRFVKENNAEWILKEHSIQPLRADEFLVILSATMIIDGESLKTANLFFQTFQRNSEDDWKLVRSYIEAGVDL